VEAGANQAIESRRLEAERREEILAILRRQLGELALDLCREGDDLRLLTARGDRLT